MYNSFTQLKSHPKYEAFLYWGKLISIIGSAQLIVQVLGFVSGILIIRLMPVQEYAYYTLANTMLGTMTILADGGISTGVMVQGGKVWQDKEKLGIVLATGLDLRRKFAIGSLIVSVPILFYLLLHNGASILTASLIALALIPAFFAALSDSLLEIVPKLHQAILPLQKNQVSVSTIRLALTGITMFVFPWAFIAVLAAGLPRIWGNIKLRKIAYGLADENQLPEKEIRAEILTLVKRIMPGAIYYIQAGQISIWLISLFGNINSIAQLGALGRLSMLLSLLSVLFSILIIPRFAKLESNKQILLRYYVQIMILIFVLLSILIIAVYFFPSTILWVLGVSYKGLPFELLLSVIASCNVLLYGISFSLYSSRGWVIKPFFSTVVSFLPIIIGCFIFDISNLRGVLFLNIFTSIVQVFLHFWYGYYKISSLKSLVN